MDIESLKTGCPNCSSPNFEFSETVPVVEVSAGGCRVACCSDGNKYIKFECFNCLHKVDDHIYDKSKDGRKEAIDRVMTNGGTRSLLRID